MASRMVVWGLLARALIQAGLGQQVSALRTTGPVLALATWPVVPASDASPSAPALACPRIGDRTADPASLPVRPVTVYVTGGAHAAGREG